MNKAPGTRVRLADSDLCGTLVDIDKLPAGSVGYFLDPNWLCVQWDHDPGPTMERCAALVVCDD